MKTELEEPVWINMTTELLLPLPRQDNIRVNVSPAAQSLVTYVRQALEHLTSPAYHCNSAEPRPLSFLCSSVILCPSRTDDLVGLFVPSQSFRLQLHNFNRNVFYGGQLPIRAAAIVHGEFFWIDNDSFEACPIEVNVLKDAVNSFPLTDDFPTSIVPPYA
ncbi:hypothetical protein TSMEX_011306 [Taenia solium]|eukprot:TsM_000940700 transcript=TsM_000940700 gene=TsM_000940700